MEFSRQEYSSGLPCPSPGDFLNPGMEPMFPDLTGWFFTTGSPGKPKSGKTKKWSTSKKSLKKFVHLNFYIWGQHYTKPGKKKKPKIGSHLVGDHLRHDYGIIPREGDSLYKTIEQMWKANEFRSQFRADACIWDIILLLLSVCVCVYSVMFDPLWPHGL